VNSRTGSGRAAVGVTRASNSIAPPVGALCARQRDATHGISAKSTAKSSLSLRMRFIVADYPRASQMECRWGCLKIRQAPARLAEELTRPATVLRLEPLGLMRNQ